MRRWVLLLLLALFIMLPVLPVQAAQGTVYVIPVHGVISDGLAQQVARGVREAEQMGARAILLEIDTPGGAINAAIKISNILTGTGLDTISFIKGDALSAGALITFSTDRIAMAPGSTIGAAEPRRGTEKAGEKVVSAWTAKLRDVAEMHGRDGNVAAAMSDADIEIPDLVAKGKLLTLTSRQAVALGMADTIKNSREEVLDFFGYPEARVVVQSGSAAEQLARWVTHPFVSPVLLMLGVAGLVLELFTVGFGIAGSVGLLAMALFFGGHYLAGVSGWEAILLFFVGIILVALEVLVIPGFGIAGIGGLALMLLSIILASTNVTQAFISLLVALLGTALLLLVSIRFLPTRTWWRNLILGEKQDRGTGYLATSESNRHYLGKTGTALSPLRPSGTAEFDGEPVDVVSDQGYIPQGTQVKVVKVEGRRIVVRKV